MKTKLIFMTLILCVIFTSCESKTKYGDCIGIAEKEDPVLNYDYSIQNIVVGAILVEMIFPPIIVVVKEIKCPVSKKGSK